MSDTIGSKLAALPKNELFGEGFLNAYGDTQWLANPANETAAHQYRIELISRIATARLSYGRGTEKRALESIAQLFEKARSITASNVGCGVVEILVWHTLNLEVRPFTSKWHPMSLNGVLDALDSSDIFRAELYAVQNSLRLLERALSLFASSNSSFDPLRSETLAAVVPPAREAVWRPAGGDPIFGRGERDAVNARRDEYRLPHHEWAAGIALSGGGIRSATFSLGVLAALSRKNLLPHFDYLSTVSGGGYAGCFLTSLLGTSDAAEKERGLWASQEPFKQTERESDQLARVRHQASFLSAGFTERLLLAMRTMYGIFVNALLAFGAIALIAAIEVSMRATFRYTGLPVWVGWFCPVVAMFLLSNVSRKERLQLKELNAWHICLGFLFAFPFLGIVSSAIHDTLMKVPGYLSFPPDAGTLTSTLLIGAIILAIPGAIFATFARARSFLIPAVTVLMIFMVEHAFYASFTVNDFSWTISALGGMAMVVAILWFLVDVNETSLYRYYRSKLATAFIPTDKQQASPRLSDFKPDLTFFPLINCAFNAPGSEDPKMRGRLCDVFTLTPQMTGSNLLGYYDTKEWEKLNPSLDLAAAMAISGGAVSPQMGLRTTRQASFWLTLFNLRLNAWLRRPTRAGEKELRKALFRRQPGIGYLFREFRASANEKLPYVNISDGGHIENLGVYELLRRRCRFILAIDGEADPNMTFHALTNLQRLAYIDMGIHIDAELDEIRLLDTGFSRSHFRFCRVRFPTGDAESPWEVGYLLYVKLSLTGNEGEFLRRYRLDEPTFPHHSTLDQFFSETQFEAYRSLGEHIGEKLFMTAILGDMANDKFISVDKWMRKYADNLGENIPV